jgi:glycosyltransferase involved in cell wall biosynthesis
MPFIAKRVYPWADAVVAVSDGVAQDTSEYLGISRDRIQTIYNPCAVREIRDESKRPVDHPWFADDQCPVVISSGRLHIQKDQGTLMRAFKIVRAKRRVRLAILGEGGERARLLSLAEDLGIIDDCWLPGSVDNPFAYLAKASVFVLSSRWEGFGLVIVEAMACGIPVVSTDCPHGPREILEDGRYGLLVPVGDAQAMAEAIEQMLDSPMPSEVLRSGAERFATERIAGEYLKLIMR